MLGFRCYCLEIFTGLLAARGLFWLGPLCPDLHLLGYASTSVIVNCDCLISLIDYYTEQTTTSLRA